MQESKNSFFGMHVSKCCEKLVEEAKALNTEVYIDFNDIRILANKYSDANELLQGYLKESQKRAAEYENSEEYKKEKLATQAQNNAIQIKLDDEMLKLDSLDFSNHKQVLKWLCDIQDFTDTIGIKVPVGTILSTFDNKGYYPNVNVGDKFKEDDSENFAHYIVGQALDGLQQVGAIHGVIHRFVAQWNNKFN